MRETTSFAKHVLSSGLRVYFQPRNLPWFAASLAVEAGHRDDPAGLSNLAHITEHMMSTGTAGYPRRLLTTLTKWLERHEVKFDLGATEVDLTAYSGQAPIERAPFYFRYLRDFVLVPLLDQDLEKEREIIRAERTDDSDERDRAHERAVSRALFGDHPLASAGLWPEDDELGKVGYDDVRGFHRRLYHPNNMILVVAGGLDERRLLGRLERLFTADSSQPPPRPRPSPMPLLAPTSSLIETRLAEPKNVESVALAYSWQLPPSSRGLAGLLAQSLQTVLTYRVREKAQAVYEISVNVERLLDHIRLTIESEVRPGKLAKVRRTIEHALTDLSAVAKEVPKTKRSLVLTAKLRDEPVRDLVETAASEAVLHGEPIPWGDFLTAVDGLSGDDVCGLLRSQVTLDRCVVSVLEH